MLMIRLPKVLFLMLMTFLAGCGESEFRIGFSAPLSGHYAEMGRQGEMGVLLAVETLNARGGIMGRPVKLIVRDDEGTRSGAVKADMELAEADVCAIIGHMTSSVAMATLPLMKQHGIPYISPTVSTPHLTGIKDLFFRVQPENTEWAAGLSTFLFTHTDVRSLLLAEDIDNSDYTFTVNDAIATSFQNDDGKIIGRMQFSARDNHWIKQLIHGVERTRPDAVVLAASAHDFAKFAKAFRPRFPDTMLIMSSWAVTPGMIKQAGQAAEGVISAISYTDDNSHPDFLDFVKRFKKRFGIRPGFAAARAYDAMLVVATGLEKAGGDPDALPRNLAPMLKVPGVTGTFDLDEYGDVKRPVYILKVENGRFRTLEMP